MGRLWDMLTGNGAPSPAQRGRHTPDELHLAAAALLVEAATVDSNFDADERGRILAYARDGLGLTAERAKALIATAEKAVAESTQLYGFTRVVKSSFSYDERVRLIETLWEVVYSDGKADAHEQQLVRRLGDLIYVTDRDRGHARKRVLARLEGAGRSPAKPRRPG
jgi:uncharacterized tellurite resistance protein B-like protein